MQQVAADPGVDLELAERHLEGFELQGRQLLEWRALPRARRVGLDGVAHEPHLGPVRSLGLDSLQGAHQWGAPPPDVLHLVLHWLRDAV